MSQIGVSVAQKESDDKSRRLKLVLAENARNGKKHGGSRPFGWAEDRVTLHPEEAPRLLEVIEEPIAGTVSLNAAGDRLGIDGSNLKRKLANPRLYGARTYKGEVVAVGEWEPLVSEETFHLLQKAIERPPQQHQSTGKQNPLLGMMWCGECGGRMYGLKGNRGARSYHCTPGRNRGGCGNLINAALTEQAIFTAGLGLLDTFEIPEIGEEQRVELEADRDDLAARIAALELDFYVEGRVSEAGYRAARQALDNRLADVELELRKRPRRPSGSECSASDLYAEMTPHEIADLLATIIHRITVQRARVRGRFDATRLQIELAPDAVPRG